MQGEVATRKRVKAERERKREVSCPAIVVGGFKEGRERAHTQE